MMKKRLFWHYVKVQIRFVKGVGNHMPHFQCQEVDIGSQEVTDGFGHTNCHSHQSLVNLDGQIVLGQQSEDAGVGESLAMLALGEAV
jgi:hypothetical protein